ncbi:MAG: DUF4340 domain-containing protein [Deltaproteobacteria bacterium]|nr:DUF4340 domain-containing protein [Deltaproteobacteria bacterium]
MNRAFTYLLIAIGLAAAVFALERVGSKHVAEKSAKQPFVALDQAKVVRIEIERLLDGVELLREGDQWMVRPLTTTMRKQFEAQDAKTPARGGSEAGPGVGEPPPEVAGERGVAPSRGSRPAEGTAPKGGFGDPADPVKVTEALNAWRDLKTDSLVSTNPEQQARYQVNQLGLQIRAYDAEGNLLAKAVVGKQGPDFISTYIQPGGGAEVYLTREALQARFSPRTENWQFTEVAWPGWLARHRTAGKSIGHSD